MRKTVLLLLFSVSAYSQMVVGEYSVLNEYPKRNKSEPIEIFKTKKTLFVLPQVFTVKEYTDAIAGVWDVTPFDVILSPKYKEMTYEEKEVKYNLKEYSVFQLSTSKINKTYKSGSDVDYVFHTLDLSIYKFKKQDKKGLEHFDMFRSCTIFFTADIAQRQKDFPLSKMNPRLFLNYDLGYLRAYLKIVNKSLKVNDFVNCYDDFYDKEAIKNLKNQKLYIPQWVADKYNAFTREKGETRKEEDIMQDYKFPYEIVSDEKLNQMLLNNESFYFLSYVQLNGKKLLSIIDYKNGEIIYNTKTNLSYNVKGKDFKSISNKIED